MPTINRDMKNVKVRTFTTGDDAYGQSRQSTYTDRDVQMAIKLYTQTNTTDIRYASVEVIGLTKDASISDANQIIDGNTTYNILYVVPFSRYTQIFMKKA